MHPRGPTGQGEIDLAAAAENGRNRRRLGAKRGVTPVSGSVAARSGPKGRESVAPRFYVRPSERFRQWVKEYGVTRLARSLGVRRSAVCSWTHSVNPRSPNPHIGIRILELSLIRPGSYGPLVWPDVYQGGVVKAAAPAPVEKPRPSRSVLQMKARAEARFFWKLCECGMMSTDRALDDLSISSEIERALRRFAEAQPDAIRTKFRRALALRKWAVREFLRLLHQAKPTQRAA